MAQVRCGLRTAATALVLLTLVVVIGGPLPAVHASLIAVYSIQRHGARNVLPKSALLAESSIIGGPTLLPQGWRCVLPMATIPPLAQRHLTLVHTQHGECCA